MKSACLLPAVFLCTLPFVAPRSEAQNQPAAPAESTGSAPLVRVKPADIGPKKGRGDFFDSVPGGETGEDSGESDSENDTAAAAPDAAALEIIFDCSNSMNARLGGVPKIDLAKQALYHLTDSLEKTNLKLGFRVFGHDRTIDREDRPRACVNSKLVIPFAERNAAKIRARIPGLVAWGRTPIAYSLEEAGKDLDPYLENSPMILLISDGVESCDRDPVKAILKLRDRGVNVRTFVIGFDLNEKERLALQQIAAVGNGKYYNARNYAELLRSFDRFASDLAIAPAPPRKKYSNPAQGGPAFEKASVIGPGRYTVWKDLAKGERGYFKVESKKGQRVAVRAVIQGKAIYRDDDGTFREAKHVDGGTQIHFLDPEGEEISGRKILLRGELGEWYRQHTLDITGEGSFFAIGDNYGPTSRHVVFEVIVQEAGDLYEGWEAPESIKEEGIFEAPLDDPFYGHLGTEDRGDVYKLDLGAAGSPASVKLTAAFSDVDDECAFLVELYDAGKKRIARHSKLKSKATLDLPTAGHDTVYLFIKDNNPSLYHLMNSYRIELKSGK